MAVTETRYEHISINDKGEPIIKRANFKVAQLALDRIAHGFTPEEMKAQHPHLTLGQIHSALAYYEDHREEIESLIEAELKTVDAHKRHTGDSRFIARLKEKGLLDLWSD